MWHLTRTDARDLINLAHAARVFSGTRGVGEDTEWVLEAAMAGGDVVIAQCASVEEAETVRAALDSGLQDRNSYLDLSAV